MIPTSKDFWRRVQQYENDIDECVFLGTTLNNLNCLQFATFRGDVRGLEKAAVGASLDYTICGKDTEADESLPPTCTALVLGCTFLATVSKHDIYSKEAKKINKGVLECCVLLVQLGANIETKLIIPPDSQGQFSNKWRSLGLHGKSVEQIAYLSGKQELIETMQNFKDRKAAINDYFCRCGSRLPWMKCHATLLIPKNTFIHESGDKMLFLWSPLARCPCNKSNLTYFECCWAYSTPFHQNEKTGDDKNASFAKAMCWYVAFFVRTVSHSFRSERYGSTFRQYERVCNSKDD